MTNGRDLRQDSSAGREVLRVLLVDDHAPVLRFLALAFKSNGCVVSTAASAEEAFEPFQSRVWLVFRNVPRFLVRALNCERRPNHPQRPSRFRSSLLAVRWATPLPASICRTAV